MPTTTLPYDPAEDLRDPVDQAELLSEALASNDPKYIAVALSAVARARGMSASTPQPGASRPRALSQDSDPQLSTLLAVLSALGLKLQLAAIKDHELNA